MKTIVIGVTSSIACFKVVELVKKLKKDFNVEVILNENAEKLIDKKEFKVKVHTGMFVKGWSYKDYIKRRKTEHISLADKADLFLICPTTANTIGKIAYGIADDLLTTSVMATNAPKVLCPAMNCKMWENRIVQENVDKLRKEGYYFIMPEKGKLACGYTGIGRLSDVGKIANIVSELVGKKDKLKGKKIIVTAGATIEEIDPVRIITNKSSGKMGVYIAEEAAKMGATVTLIRGKTEVEPYGRVRDVQISSVEELFNEIKKNVKKNDIIIHTAAVSDFSMKEKNNKKIKSGVNLHLELTPTTKIFEKIKKLNRKIKLIGFKAEYKVSDKELVNRAYDSLKKAKADFVVANDVGKGVFGSEDNDVYVVDNKKKVKHVKGSKREIGNRILELVI